MKKTLAAAVVSVAVALVVTATASAHATMSPAVSVAGTLQLYSLAVPTEKQGLTTTKVVLTTPRGFDIDSFVPNPGWNRSAAARTVSWSGGSTPTGEDSLFQFLAQPDKPGTYTFQVTQTYSDGSIVNWNGAADDPAPAIEAKSSLGGGGSSTLAIVAIVLGGFGVVLGLLALVARSGRPLA